MLKCILIYLWIYIGLFYITEAGDDNEHVHIKLHMTSGQQRKRAQIKQYHKNRHSPSPPTSSHHNQQSHPLPPPPPPSSQTIKNIYNESPHKYLTTTSSTSSLEPQQHHIFSRSKKYPSSAALLQMHENGQLLSTDDEVYNQGDIDGDDGVSSGGASSSSSSLLFNTDTDVGEHMRIPSYFSNNFALFPQPTTTYETEIIPHTSEGFNVVEQALEGVEALEEDNEIPKHKEKGTAGILDMFTLENYKRHKPSSYSSIYSTSSGKTIKNEQLLQQLLQQQHYNSNSNEKPEIMNAAAYKSNKPKGSSKYRAENDYHSEDDMMYSSKYNPAHNFKRPEEEEVAYSGNIKTLTVDDIWSQLQQQYLNKYTPQAQTITSVEIEEPQQHFTITKPKIKPKHKRNTKRPKINRPNISSFTNSWPVKTLSYGSSISSNSNNKHYKHQHKQPQHQYNEDLFASLPSASAFNSGRLTSHRDADLFAKTPFNKFTASNGDDDVDDNEDDTSEIDDSRAALYSEDNEDEVDIYDDNNHDESLEDAVYQQRGKKFIGHTVYGQHSHANNPFNYHDLYGSYSTPVAATIATNIQPSTYHPNNLVSTTSPAYTTAASSSTSSFLTALSQHPSTSYQWRTQQNYPASYQTYHLQHQQQQPQRTSSTATTTAEAIVVVGGGGGSGEEQYDEHHKHHDQHQYNNAALRLSKNTITQTPNTITTSKFLPIQSNDFRVISSSSSPILSSSPTIVTSAKSTAQTPPERYKKRKNRIKTKRNRIVVI